MAEGRQTVPSAPRILLMQTTVGKAQKCLHKISRQPLGQETGSLG